MSQATTHDFSFHPPTVEFHLCRWRYLEQWTHNNMAAPFWRWYWNPDPGAWIKRDGQRFDLIPDRWTLISPGTSLETGHTSDFHHLFIHFSLSSVTRLKSSMIIQGPMNHETRQSLDELYQNTQTTPGISQQQGYLFSALVMHALSQLPESTWWSPQDTRIQHALSLLHQRPFIHYSVDDLAEAVHLHPKSFSRLFSQETGMPPHRYGLELRLDAAANDLVHRDHSVEQVAEAWGFSDRFHLTRMLKKHRNTTPGQLRSFK